MFETPTEVENTAKRDAVYYYMNHSIKECKSEIFKEQNTPSMGAAHLYMTTYTKYLLNLIKFL
jgi:hypothetical protein